ncbi:MAG: tetratricopeptide repeat protein, partial [Polyangiales bacterium]
MLSWREAPALASPAHAESADAPAPRFDPDSIKPSKNTARKAALDARVLGNHGEARAKALAGMSQAKGQEATYLRWIAGQASRSLGDLQGSANLLMPIAQGDHPLASWAKLSVAECYESKDPVHALALLDSLLAPSRDMRGWPGRAPAERARARVLDKLGRREDAILAFEKLAADAKDEASFVQILLPLAELLKEGDEQARVRSYTLARRVAMRVAPESRAGKRADELAKQMLGTLPSELQKELSKPRPEDKLLRADELASQLRYEEAAQAYAAVESAALNEPEVACRARYGRAKALLDKRARGEGSVLMAEVADKCTLDTDRRAWARYHAGRAFSSLGQNETAVRQFEALEREAPSHSLADDALYRAARTYKDMGDPAGMTSRLELISQRYPSGDMHLRARFALAWEAAQSGDLKTAIDIVSDEPRDEPTEDLQGRSAYFRAKWLAEAGDLTSAIEAYVAAFNKAPISYFGQLAHARLHNLAPERAKEAVARLSRARGVKLTFERRPEL